MAVSTCGLATATPKCVPGDWCSDAPAADHRRTALPPPETHTCPQQSDLQLGESLSNLFVDLADPSTGGSASATPFTRRQLDRSEH